MRTAALVGFVVCAAVSTSFATAAYEHSETLVGWSTDGTRFAVIVTSSESPDGATLEVRDAKKQLVRFKDGDKGVPEATEDRAGVARLDVEKWEPLRAHGLRRVDAAARTRFKDTLEATALGKRTSDPYDCKGGGWSVKRKGSATPFHEVKGKGGACFKVLGGYLHASGRHALIKLTESSRTSGEDGTTSDDITRFVLVDVPAP